MLCPIQKLVNNILSSESFDMQDDVYCRMRVAVLQHSFRHRTLDQRDEPQHCKDNLLNTINQISDTSLINIIMHRKITNEL